MTYMQTPRREKQAREIAVTVKIQRTLYFPQILPTDIIANITHIATKMPKAKQKLPQDIH